MQITSEASMDSGTTGYHFKLEAKGKNIHESPIRVCPSYRLGELRIVSSKKGYYPDSLYPFPASSSFS